MFATGHDREVKLWDIRKLDEDKEFGSLMTDGSSSLRKIQFDPNFGKLLLTQDLNTVKIFSVKGCMELDYYHSNQTFVTS